MDAVDAAPEEPEAAESLAVDVVAEQGSESESDVSDADESEAPAAEAESEAEPVAVGRQANVSGGRLRRWLRRRNR